MIDERAHKRLRVGASSCGIFYALVLFAGWGLVASMMLPVWSPERSTAAVATSFQDDTLRIRIGMLLTMVAALFAIPFTAAVSQQLARIEGHVGILSWCAGIGGIALMVLTFYPAIFWLVAAYRPDRAEELTKLMNDLGWLQLISGVTVFLALPLAVAVAAFVDSSPVPIFPRWAAYYNIWTVLLILPDQLLFFFKNGPFAWNGIFGFWVPVVAFGSWFFVMFFLLKRAIGVAAPRCPALADRYLQHTSRSREHHEGCDGRNSLHGGCVAAAWASRKAHLVHEDIVSPFADVPANYHSKALKRKHRTSPAFQEAGLSQ